MLDRYLIKHTTREQREQIVRESLSCGAGGCENCSSCGAYGTGDPFEMFRPYIEGRRELEQINRDFNARFLHTP